MRIDEAKIRESIDQENRVVPEQRISVYSESYKGEYYNIDIDKLIPFRNQARKNFDQESLKELASTIKIYGIRQPLTILPSEDHSGKYEIISGERRWRAAQILELRKVPCIILHDRSKAEEIALVENVQRKNLHPLELMKGFQSLLDKKICKSQQEIADRVGISRTVIVEILALNKLPVATQDLLLSEQVKSRKILRELIKSPVTDHARIIERAAQVKKNGFVRRIKSDVKKSQVLQIYCQSEEIMFQESPTLDLTSIQKERISAYLQDFLDRISK